MEIIVDENEVAFWNLFKIDLIVWKLVKRRIGSTGGSLFKIDLIVWKLNIE